MEKITIFYGSSKDYRALLESKGISLDDAVLFPELISQYNETIRASRLNLNITFRSSFTPKNSK